MKKITLLLMSILFFSNITYAESIGVVDIQKVLQNYQKTEVLAKELEKKQLEVKESLEKKQAKLKKAQDDNKKPEELQKLVEEMQKELQPQQEEFNELRYRHLSILQADVIKATKKISKEYGIDIVFDKQAILTGGFDLTDFVIEHLNK